MIKVTQTSRYNINPKKIINDAFEGAFGRYVETLPVSPPDKPTMISGVLSMLLLILMFILTANRYEEQATIWITLAVVCGALAGLIVYKFIKAQKEFLKSAGRPSTKDAKKKAFFALFTPDGTALPEQMPAGELIRKVSPLVGKQTDEASNSALRAMSETQALTNNPEDVLCKLVTTFGDIFTQPKRRLYFRQEGGSLVFYDSEWMKPKGEIVCAMEDVASFGTFSKYPLRINSSGGGKINPDAVIVEIQDSDHHIYFEFQNRDYDKLKKILPGKKELK